MLYKKLGGYGMEDTTKVDAESMMPEADSEEAVSEVDKKVKVPKSKRFGKKESAKQPVKDKLTSLRLLRVSLRSQLRIRIFLMIITHRMSIDSRDLR